MPKIELKNLHVDYYNRKNKEYVTAIDDLSYVFKDNSFNVVVGYSGCGKTTLLESIIGLIDYEGDIFVNDKNYKELSVSDKNIAYVSQNYGLYPHLNVFDNIAFSLKNKGCERAEIIERVNKVAEELGISHCLSRKPKELSGGQQQRVALARALVKKSFLFLFDEPLSNVDPKQRVVERKLIRELVKKYRATAIYVTHDFQEALSLADNLVVMDEGKIVISGDPQVVYNSDNEVVNYFKKAIYGK